MAGKEKGEQNIVSKKNIIFNQKIDWLELKEETCVLSYQLD
ncbi:MAG: hypothetical protein QNJ41_29745 [Xenococcaceae cyanobacterium MO_188.B32]|nr:hypothetical protein [Xenococcaceae cyanobacterium MO_188.B32]